MAVAIEPFFFDRDQLLGRAHALHATYARARPFSHVVIDDFLPEPVVDAVLAEFPSPHEVSWWEFDTADERKLASRDESTMGPHTRLVLAQLNSAAFVEFLEELTGIRGLVPDPMYFGGGLHQIQRGGLLAVHADFNRHPVTELHRRLNLLLYLNHDWREEYAGHLELWNRTMTRCGARIAPHFNRCVIFNTGRYSYHGHPQPLNCPEGDTRKSLALYYYSLRADPDWPGEDNPTVFRKPTRGAARAKVLARRLLPPIVVDAIRGNRTR